MTSVAATSAAAEEASEQLALRRKEREQAAGGLEEGALHHGRRLDGREPVGAAAERGPQFVGSYHQKVFKTIFAVRSRCCSPGGKVTAKTQGDSWNQ